MERAGERKTCRKGAAYQQVGERDALIEFEAVAREGRVHFLGVGVDPAGEGVAILEAVASEPRDMVEDAGAGVVVEDDFLLCVLGR